MAKRRFATSAEVHARELGVSETQARRWLLEGMPEKEPSRSRWVNARADQRSGDEVSADLQAAHLAQKIKRLINQNKEAELRLRRLEGELVPLLEVKRQLAGLAAAVRNGLLGLPGKLADRVIVLGTAAAAEELLREEIEGVLRVLADDVGADAGTDLA